MNVCMCNVFSLVHGTKFPIVCRGLGDWPPTRYSSFTTGYLIYNKINQIDT